MPAELLRKHNPFFDDWLRKKERERGEMKEKEKEKEKNEEKERVKESDKVDDMRNKNVENQSAQNTNDEVSFNNQLDSNHSITTEAHHDKELYEKEENKIKDKNEDVMKCKIDEEEEEEGREEEEEEEMSNALILPNLTEETYGRLPPSAYASISKTGKIKEKGGGEEEGEEMEDEDNGILLVFNQNDDSNIPESRRIQDDHRDHDLDPVKKELVNTSKTSSSSTNIRSVAEYLKQYPGSSSVGFSPIRFIVPPSPSPRSSSTSSSSASSMNISLYESSVASLPDPLPSFLPFLWEEEICTERERELREKERQHQIFEKARIKAENEKLNSITRQRRGTSRKSNIEKYVKSVQKNLSSIIIPSKPDVTKLKERIKTLLLTFPFLLVIIVILCINLCQQ